eukprot:CAMPEP_0198217796 /NCGR_PEP_ID=MMETSP1445-20131203/65854_1 /TAXON_ID=36898 /ORGANISM="Pyramimonas sp., Strain CCMP2087" /LENGTH=147 /DNA_ID=CAMNT_0043894607 /DNA_START=447 /DNA_END=887 /DNA_ORIENTATION=+
MKEFDVWTFLNLGGKEASLKLLDATVSIDMESDHTIVIFVSGNWYDKHKVPEVVALTKRFPEAVVLLTGGVGRLTDSRSRELGGESLHMREMLIAAGVPSNRMVIYTGGRVTTHNLQLLAHFLKETVEGRFMHSVTLLAVEESYLSR